MKPVERYPFERFSTFRSYYAFDFVHDGDDIVYSANTSGQFNIWRESPASEFVSCSIRQLTAFVEWTPRFIEASSDGRFIICFADKDGDENYQIFTVDAKNGWHAPLDFKPGIRKMFGMECISPTGQLAGYSSNERTPQETDIVIANIATRQTRTILAKGGLYTFGYWSPEGLRATIIDSVATSDSDILLVNVKSGNSVNLTHHRGKTIYSPGPWTAGGDGFLVLSNEGREFIGLGFMSLNRSSIKWLETPNADIVDVAVSPNGRILAWVENRHGYSYINLRDRVNGKFISHPVGTGGSLIAGWFENSRLLKFSRDGRRIIFLLSKPARPAEIYMIKIPDHKMTSITNGFIGNIPERHMQQPTLVKYGSFDRSIAAFLYKPKLRRGVRAAALVSIHGGPASQEKPVYAFNGLYQFLLSQGIGVFAPNIRGSTGYGKTFQRLIYRDWGGAELQDIKYAAEYLKNLDWIDPERLGIFGASFGGFVSLSAATQIGHYWRAAVDLFGPSNLVTFASAVPDYWKKFMPEWIGDPDKEVAFLTKRSPLSYIDSITCPLLIVQGAKDPRVPRSESDQIVEKMRLGGKQVEYLVFDDEGHGFTKRKNEFIAYRTVAKFLLKHLLNEEDPDAFVEQY